MDKEAGRRRRRGVKDHFYWTSRQILLEVSCYLCSAWQDAPVQPELVKVLGTFASDASARLPGAGTQTGGGAVRVDGPVQLPDLKRTLPTGAEGKVAS